MLQALARLEHRRRERTIPPDFRACYTDTCLAVLFEKDETALLGVDSSENEAVGQCFVNPIVFTDMIDETASAAESLPAICLLAYSGTRRWYMYLSHLCEATFSFLHRDREALRSEWSARNRV